MTTVKFTRRLLLLTAAVLVAPTLAACTDKVAVIPSTIEPLGVKVPASATRFYSHERGGVPFSMFQYRFDFAARDLSSLEAQLPCTLGRVESGSSPIASVGTNDRDWYKPDQSKRHRTCEGKVGAWAFSVLLDVSAGDPCTAYLVVSD